MNLSPIYTFLLPSRRLIFTKQCLFTRCFMSLRIYSYFYFIVIFVLWHSVLYNQLNRFSEVLFKLFLC